MTRILFELLQAILPSPCRRPTGLEELNTSKHELEVGGSGVISKLGYQI